MICVTENILLSRWLIERNGRMLNFAKFWRYNYAIIILIQQTFVISPATINDVYMIFLPWSRILSSCTYLFVVSDFKMRILDFCFLHIFTLHLNIIFTTMFFHHLFGTRRTLLFIVLDLLFITFNISIGNSQKVNCQSKCCFIYLYYCSILFSQCNILFNLFNLINRNDFFKFNW